ncbi:pyridoxal phosphate-dependent aminotransferase [Actinoplanes teichomyceticus]|uniref:Succinyldiaminopimelate aminotransferase n=2 Tax=Actinoplanes teichomyceticus TaxID=1867 RepID=A0A561VQF3_ACTTI|nr:pyridoxal phosphate-dependent aminotransferase [Actinoplanes teichomyceticus]TWG13853.1 succinyldiaminopimelate aminotransferase [Actinoplanes teichomyceticus]GIF12322.1 aminotransferase [Actinoplanes teichomyceticus]
MSTDPLVERMRPFGTTIFTEMSALAARTGAINLGQGFPDTDGPPEMLAAAARALASGANQYPPLAGIPALRHAVAEHEQRFWALTRDPDTEVAVTAGATEAVAAAILALCEPGDEVVCFEPYYDSYAASITLAGAVRRPVTLRPGPDGRYSFDEAELRAAFGARTRLVLLNSPHNPTGKVFTPAELGLVAELCQEHDTWAVTDEVYEHLVFDEAHVPLAGLPGMRERTLRVSSAGKTFSCTGWKVGWVTGPARLVSAVLRVKQFLTFVNAAPLQPAVAVALGLPDSYFTGFTAALRANRDRLSAGLAAAGFDVLPSEGTYFVTADIRPLGGTDGVEFCRQLPGRCGVVAVPTQVFYDHREAGRHLIRFAFCKRAEVIDEAADRLRKLA